MAPGSYIIEVDVGFGMGITISHVFPVGGAECK